MSGKIPMSLNDALDTIPHDHSKCDSEQTCPWSGRTAMAVEAREQLGQYVRQVWVQWAREQPNPKPSWLLPWQALSEPDREVDRRIGEALWVAGFNWAREPSTTKRQVVALDPDANGS